MIEDVVDYRRIDNRLESLQDGYTELKFKVKELEDIVKSLEDRLKIAEKEKNG